MRRQQILAILNVNRFFLKQFVLEGSIIKNGRDYSFAEGFDADKCKELHKQIKFNNASTKMKKCWSDEAYRQQQTESHKVSTTLMWQNEEYREKTIAAEKAVWTEEKCQEQSRIVKIAKNTEEAKKNASIGQIQRWQNYTPEERELIKQHQRDFYDQPGAREAHSDLMKSILAPAEMRTKMSINTKAGQKRNNAYPKISKASLAMWQNSETVEKMHQAKKNNSSYGYSKQHLFSLNWLQQKNLTIEVEKQYPFEPTLHCDAYIKELNLWVEFHYHWTHYIEPYNSDNAKHKELEQLWLSRGQKAQEQNSKRKQYFAAINTWTNIDVRKLKSANAAQLNYICLYSFDEFFTFFSSLQFNDKILYPWDNYSKIFASTKIVERLSGHNCKVQEVSSETAKNFLDMYHYQSSLKTVQDVRLGLFYKDELISLATFGKPRYNKSYDYEALRYCVKSGYQIIGGAKKLYTYFEQTYKPKSIVSYQDMSKFHGTFHEMLGYKLVCEQKSWHWYNFETQQHFTDNLLRQLGADKLLGTNYGKPEICHLTNEQILERHGFIKIEDAGQRTYAKFLLE